MANEGEEEEDEEEEEGAEGGRQERILCVGCVKRAASPRARARGRATHCATWLKGPLDAWLIASRRRWLFSAGPCF